MSTNNHKSLKSLAAATAVTPALQELGATAARIFFAAGVPHMSSLLPLPLSCSAVVQNTAAAAAALM